MKNLFKKALKLTIICSLLIFSSCEKDLYVDSIQKSDKNKISLNQFINETKIKDFKTLFKVPVSANGMFNRTVELSEFVIDTVAILKYINQNNEATYAFRIYSTDVSNLNEKYNLVYRKENTIWEKSIFSLNEVDSSSGFVQSMEILFDTKMQMATMSSVCVSTSVVSQCQGCPGACDYLNCRDNVCFRYVVTTISDCGGGSGSTPSDPNGNGPINPGPGSYDPQDPFSFTPNLYDNPVFDDPNYINAVKANSFFNHLDYAAQVWANENVESYNQIIQYQIHSNWSTVSNTFANWSIDNLITNPNITFEHLLNNKTDFDTDTGDNDNNTVGSYDNTIYNDFNPQQSTWSNIPPVIPVSDFVGWGSPGIQRNCMDYAKAQIAKNGYQISNYGATGQTIQIYTEQNGANLTNLSQGLSYLKYALSNGIPVIVGVDDAPGSPNPATDNSTDHFIVIVGMGSDSNGNYFKFYDNASGNANQGASPNNKLYYNSTTGIISGQSQTTYSNGAGMHNYIITQIRKSKPN